MRSFTIVVHSEEDGGYWAEVEELPGCFASGETLDELEEDIIGAIEQHIAALKEIGAPVPPGKGAATEGIRRWEISVPT